MRNMESAVNQMDKIVDMEKKVNQLYLSLKYLTAKNTTARRQVEACELHKNGLETWRLIEIKYNPQSALRRVFLLQRIQSPGKCQEAKHILAKLAEWTKVKVRYENYEDEEGNKKVVDEDTLLAAMFEILPRSMEKDIIFHRDREQSKNWKNIYNAMTNYCDLK